MPGTLSLILNPSPSTKNLCEPRDRWSRARRGRACGAAPAPRAGCRPRVRSSARWCRAVVQRRRDRLLRHRSAISTRTTLRCRDQGRQPTCPSAQSDAELVETRRDATEIIAIVGADAKFHQASSAGLDQAQLFAPVDRSEAVARVERSQTEILVIGGYFGDVGHAHDDVGEPVQSQGGSFRRVVDRPNGGLSPDHRGAQRPNAFDPTDGGCRRASKTSVGYAQRLLPRGAREDEVARKQRAHRRRCATSWGTEKISSDVRPC